MLEKTKFLIAIIASKSLHLFKEVFKKGFFHLLSANFIISFVGFGAQLLVAKFLSPKELGQIKTMQSFLWLAILLAGFGFGTAVLKLCSEKKPQEEKAFIFKQNLYYTAFPIFFVLVVLFILAKLRLLSPDRDVNRLFPIYMLVIIPMTYISLIMVYFQALKKIQLMAKMQVILRLLGFLILVVATYFYGLIGFILAIVFSTYIATLPLYFLIKDDLKSRAKVDNVFSQSFFYARWSVAANVFGEIGRSMDIFMLNYLLKDRLSLGYYSLATIFITGLSYITSTAQFIAIPYFSEKGTDKKEFLRVLKKYQKLMILLAFVVTVFALLLVPPFIKFVYGRDYAIAGNYFRILVFKYFFWSCYALLGVAILGLGKMQYNFFSASISVPISFLLSYFFINSYGAMGAAMAQALAYLISLIIVTFMIRYVIKIHFGNSAT